MRLRLPPKKAYPHTIVYKEKVGEDDWDNPIFGNEKTIDFVRFDAQFDFKRSGNDSTNDAPNALISMLKRYTGDLPTFENGNKVIWDGHEYTIVATIPVYFDSDEAIGYELEVK